MELNHPLYDLTICDVEAWKTPMPHNHLLCGKVEYILPKMCSESIDMIFADPPFNLDKDYGENHDDNLPIEEYYEWCETWLKQAFRVLKPTGTIYLMNIQQRIFRLGAIMEKYGVFLNQIIWKHPIASKTNKDKIFRRAYQPIIAFGKSEEYYFDMYAQRKKSYFNENAWGKGRKERNQNKMPDIWDDIPFVYCGSILHKEAIVIPGTKKKIHTCQMPEMLPGRCIKFSTQENEWVLDLFGGSGTTMAASYKLNRYGIYIDQSIKYHDVALSRISKLKDVLI